jgi:uncharacterized membrane protein YedE/YeeE
VNLATRLAALAVGLVFGGVLCWSGMSSPEVLRAGLLLENSYLFLFFAAALSTAFVGLRLLNRFGTRSVITDEPLACPTQRPERRHVTGAAIFGVGWAVADVCPGPIATQLGQGIAYGIPTALGLMLGVWLYLRREQRAVAAPAPSVRAVTLPDPA